jgi:hypothetical protein
LGVTVATPVSVPSAGATGSPRGAWDEAVDLLRRLLRLDTSNPPGNETPAAELLRAYPEASGVACELVARDARAKKLTCTSDSWKLRRCPPPATT